MRLVKNIALWIIIAFLAILALTAFPSFACMFAFLIAVLIAPIEKWQNILRRFIKGKIKAIAASVLAILMFVTFPTTEPQSDSDLPIETTASIAAGTTTAPTIETSQPTTEATVSPTTESATSPAMETTTHATEATAPTTETTTPPATEATAPPATEATTPPATEATAPPATEATTPPATEATTPPATEATTPPATEATTPPATEATTPPATEATTPPATEATTPPATDPPHVHSFSTATCTSPKTCSCGAVEGTAIGHSYVNGSCSTCGASDPNHSSDVLVWIPTNGGTKYHSKASCSGMIEPRQVTKTEAENLNFTPCGKCY